MAPTRIACGVFALALVAGACASGGGSDEQPSADTSASTAAPAIDTASADEQTAPLTTEAASPATDAVVESAEPAEPAESAESAAVPEPTEPPAAVPVAPAALQFTAPAVGGGEIDAAAYAGTPTLFWFWAPT